jgi:hypothetical protein
MAVLLWHIINCDYAYAKEAVRFEEIETLGCERFQNLQDYKLCKVEICRSQTLDLIVLVQKPFIAADRAQSVSFHLCFHSIPWYYMHYAHGAPMESHICCFMIEIVCCNTGACDPFLPIQMPSLGL